MCLIGLALNAHPRWALVVAANRDEFYDRPTGGLDWWQPEPGRGAILAGRDLNAGGTWLGVRARGRVGMLTNVRDPKRHRLDAPSRGALVTEWLTSDESADALWPAWARRGCNPFNLVGGDLAKASSDIRFMPSMETACWSETTGLRVNMQEDWQYE